MINDRLMTLSLRVADDGKHIHVEVTNTLDIMADPAHTVILSQDFTLEQFDNMIATAPKERERLVREIGEGQA